MRGSFLRLTVGDYMNDTPGVLKSINVEIPKESPWEIGRDSDGKLTDLGNRLPFYLQVNNLTFIPIHENIPEYGSHFISMGDKEQGYGY
jgi:hypothetical protein